MLLDPTPRAIGGVLGAQGVAGLCGYISLFETPLPDSGAEPLYYVLAQASLLAQPLFIPLTLMERSLGQGQPFVD